MRSKNTPDFFRLKPCPCLNCAKDLLEKSPKTDFDLPKSGFEFVRSFEILELEPPFAVIRCFEHGDN